MDCAMASGLHNLLVTILDEYVAIESLLKVVFVVYSTQWTYQEALGDRVSQRLPQSQMLQLT